VTITLTLNPEIEAELLAKASARGMKLRDYLQGIVEQEAVPSTRNAWLSDQADRKCSG
jgi:hypothetical protein